MAASTRHGSTEYEMLNPVESQTHKSTSDATRPPHRIKKERSLFSNAFAVMITVLFVGVGFGLIHHFFYKYWNLRAVASDSQQRWIIRGGTAFAFGLKTSLAFGTGVAYIQYFWLCMNSRPYNVAEINSMFTILSQAMEFKNLKLWARLPVLAMLAIVTWTLPLAAIISPGTLIITPSTWNRTETQRVPQFDYRKYTNFASNFTTDGGGFSAASDDLIRLALSSATTESVLAMVPPVANSTYSIDLYAPALNCEVALANDSRSLQTQYYNWTNMNGGYQLNYFCWVPTGLDGQHACLNGSTASPPPFYSNTTFPTIDQCSEGWYEGYAGEKGWSSKLNIFIPRWLQSGKATGPVLLSDSIFLNCSLSNASYTVGFDFRKSQQLLNITKKDNVNGVPNPGQVGSAFNAGSPSSLYSLTGSRAFLAEKVASYISIMDAFGRIMAGKVQTYHYGTVTPYSTLVLSTRLRSLLATADNATLAHAVEQLFENITISLLSSSLYTVDFSNMTNKGLFPSTNLTIYYPQNIYTYQPRDLWLAYGIAVLSNIICLLIAMVALNQNGLSYSNNFTTILRTTRNQNLDVLVKEGESSGADPVPAHTASGTLIYRRSAAYGWAGFSIRGMR